MADMGLALVGIREAPFRTMGGNFDMDEASEVDSHNSQVAFVVTSATIVNDF